MEFFTRKFVYPCWQFLRWVSKPLCFRLLLFCLCLSPFNDSREKKLRRIPQIWLSILSELISRLCYFSKTAARMKPQKQINPVPSCSKGGCDNVLLFFREMKYCLFFGLKGFKLREITKLEHRRLLCTSRLEKNF